MRNKDSQIVGIGQPNERAKDGEVGCKASVLEAPRIPSPESSPQFLCEDPDFSSDDQVGYVPLVNI